MKHDISAYLLTEEEKQSLIKRLTQDISFSDEDLFDSERDVYNTEIVDQYDTEEEVA